jgi:gliding motility-associated-like protein
MNKRLSKTALKLFLFFFLTSNLFSQSLNSDASIAFNKGIHDENWLNKVKTVYQTATICCSEPFRLPLGQVVTTSGIYHDTFKILREGIPAINMIVVTDLKIKNTLPTHQKEAISLKKGIIPNGNEANRRLKFSELDDTNPYQNSEIVVLNRLGQVVFQAKPYLNDWEGKNQNNQDLPAGTYYYILRLNTADSKLQKGDVTIIR